MKIEQLLQREPFGDILESTLSRFFSTLMGYPHRATWKKIAMAQRVAGCHTSVSGERFFCNPYLNILFPTNPGHAVFGFVRDNYMHTPFRHRRLIQKLYVILATHPYTAPYLSTHILHIHPGLPDSRNLVILGGNNRIRIIDLHKMRTWDVLKTGFDLSYMAAELAVRYQPGTWPFPQLYAVGEDKTWYESEYVNAVSLNRIAGKDDDNRLVKQAMQFLGKWLDLSSGVASANNYAKSLIAKMEVEFRDKYNGDTINPLFGRLIGVADNILEICQENGDFLIHLANGHGDFQQGNILVDSFGKIWIVDWEHAGQRQIAYDYLVFALQSRFPAGLSNRIQIALERPDSIFIKLPIVHEKFRSAFLDLKQRPFILMIFLLEELLWYLRENANPIFSKVSGAMPQLMAEIMPSLQSIRCFLR